MVLSVYSQPLTVSRYQPAAAEPPSELPEAELIGQGEAVLHRPQAFRRRGVGEAGGGAADGELQAILHLEALVESVEHAGGERIARAGRALAVTGREA